jgi:hypothetical protein
MIPLAGLKPWRIDRRRNFLLIHARLDNEAKKTNVCNGVRELGAAYPMVIHGCRQRPRTTGQFQARQHCNQVDN